MKRYFVVKERIESKADFCKLYNIDINNVIDIKRDDWFDLEINKGKTYTNSFYTITYNN